MIALLALFFAVPSYSSSVRELPLKPYDVGIIHTARGFSTVVQLPSKPLNVVLGDQGAFRIEFINDSITIKPIRSNARSNLFIFTEKERYNLTLASGAQSSVDYVVRLKRIFEDQKQIRALNKRAERQGLQLTLLKITKSGNSSFLDFQVTNKSRVKVTLNPENFRFLSHSVSEPIKGLFIEAVNLEPGQSITGSLSLSNLNSVLPCTVLVGIKDKKPIRFAFDNFHEEAKNAIKRMD